MKTFPPIAALSFTLDGTPQPAVQVLCPEHHNVLTTYIVFAGMWVERSPMAQRRQVDRMKAKYADSADPLAAIRAVRNRRQCNRDNCRRTVPDTGSGTDNNFMDWLYAWGESKGRIDTDRPTLRVGTDEFDALFRHFTVSK